MALHFPPQLAVLAVLLALKQLRDVLCVHLLIACKLYDSLAGPFGVDLNSNHEYIDLLKNLRLDLLLLVFVQVCQ